MTSREALRTREVMGDDQLCKWLGMKPSVLTAACLYWGLFHYSLDEGHGCLLTRMSSLSSWFTQGSQG